MTLTLILTAALSSALVRAPDSRLLCVNGTEGTFTIETDKAEGIEDKIVVKGHMDFPAWLAASLEAGDAEVVETPIAGSLTVHDPRRGVPGHRCDNGGLMDNVSATSI